MKDKHHGKGDKDKEHQLSTLLNHAMLTFPSKFLSDFPLMINSLDSGESVNVDSISDPAFRAILNQIMRCLPLEHSYEFGFYKKENTKPIGGNILKQLLDARCIRQPTELNNSERLASQHVPMVVLSLLTAFPALKKDLFDLLSNVKDGQAVQLENIANDDIREGLERLFKSLELVYSSRSGCYELPEGKKANLVEDAIDHVLESLKCDASYEKAVAKATHKSDKKKHKKDRKDDKKHSNRSSNLSDSDSLIADDSSSSSDDSEDDKDGRPDNSDSEDSTVNNEIVIAGVASSLKSSDSLSERENEEVVGPSAAPPRVGPSMPSAAELKAAQHAYEQYVSRGGEQGVDDEEQQQSSDEDDFGPQMYDAEKERRKAESSGSSSDRPLNSHLVKMQQVPLGFMETALESIEAQQNNVYQQRYGEYVEQDEEEATRRAAGATVREEWILDPGSNKLISEMNGIGTMNRKFQSGKAAKKIAQQVSAAKALVEGGPESAEAKAIMDEYRQARGPSLYEQHLEKNPNASASSSNSAGMKRKAFDRDVDMATNTKLDKFQVKKLVDNARELDSRFDKGSVQKSFL